MAANPSIVITGMGVVSPIGVGLQSFWDNLCAGHSGIKVRPEFEGSDIPLNLAARVSDFDPRQYIANRKAIKVMCVPIQHGCAAAMMACQQAGLQPETANPDRVGTIFGTETFFADPLEVADVFRHCMIDRDYQHERWGEFAMRKIQPLWMLKYLPNMVASHVSIMLDARGHSNSICQREVSGLIALIEAAHVIQRGWCDVMVVGGTGSLCELSAMLYRGNNLSKAFFDQPHRSSRPFDLHRDGMVPGEGAAAFVIESADHANRRGAPILARLDGWSMSFGDPASDQFSQSFSQSITDCFEAALSHAHCKPQEISAINADAGGRIVEDAAEAQAIERLFGKVPVVANKGHFGNLGPGTAAVETVATVLSISNRWLPPTLNCDDPDPNCPVEVNKNSRPLLVAGPSRAKMLKAAISETGQIAAIVLSEGGTK